VIGFLELPVARNVLLEILGICDTLQVAADDRGRFIVFGNRDGVKPLLAVRNINVAAHQIQQVCSLKQDLGHPRVVVISIRNVAIVASSGFLRPHGVRHECAEGSAAEPLGGNSLLHVVQPVAILILRTDDDRAGRTNRGDAVARHGAVNSEHESVVAKNLKIVAGVVTRGQTLIVKHGFALVRHHR
jgi:hypothetical protein